VFGIGCGGKIEVLAKRSLVAVCAHGQLTWTYSSKLKTVALRIYTSLLPAPSLLVAVTRPVPEADSYQKSTQSVVFQVVYRL